MKYNYDIGGHSVNECPKCGNCPMLHQSGGYIIECCGIKTGVRGSLSSAIVEWNNATKNTDNDLEIFNCPVCGKQPRREEILRHLHDEPVIRFRCCDINSRGRYQEPAKAAETWRSECNKYWHILIKH